MPIAINTTPTTTHLALLIDSSGSMRGLGDKVTKNVNSILESLQTKAAELGQKVLVSLYSFGGTVDTLMLRTPIDRSPRLKESDYTASGTTPMVPAILRAIADLEAVDGKDIANLVTIVTDGEADGDYALTSTNAKMAKLTGNDRWTFSFLIPRGNRSYIDQRFPSTPAGNIQEWDTTVKGLEIGSQAMASGYASYLGLRSTGATKSTGFFTAAVNTQQAQAAKQNLNDVRKDFKELTVRTQDPKTLQEFIEARALTFQKGKSFYQLSKTEKVQPEKEILLRDCSSGAIYGGAQARGILGLPAGIKVKVKPADHGTWDVFVQSTSNNRKLVNGTNLLYLK